MDNKEIDYKRAAEQLRNGEPLFGKDGALAPMLERILNAALEVRWMPISLLMNAQKAIAVMVRSLSKRRPYRAYSPVQVSNSLYCPSNT